jgi:hypothetical protein
VILWLAVILVTTGAAAKMELTMQNKRGIIIFFIYEITGWALICNNDYQLLLALRPIIIQYFYIL